MASARHHIHPDADLDVVVTNVPALHVMAVDQVATPTTIGEAMQHAFERLFGGVDAAAVAVVGPPFARYPEMPAGEFRFELCVPVGLTAGRAPPGRGGTDGAQRDAELRDIEPVRAATLRYRGAYDDVGPSWTWLLDWVRTHGYAVRGPLREVYLDDPDTCGPEGPDTLLVVPIG